MACTNFPIIITFNSLYSNVSTVNLITFVIVTLLQKQFRSYENVHICFELQNRKHNLMKNT